MRRLPRLLLGSIDPIIARLSRGISRKGDLTAHIDAIDWRTLPDDDARRLGVAVAHRGLNRTINVMVEGIDAIIDAPERVAPEYIAGLIRGLLFSADGTLTTTNEAVRYVTSLLDLYPDSAALVDDLTDRVVRTDWRESHEAPDPVDEVYQEAMRLSGDIDLTVTATAWIDLWEAVYRRHILPEPFDV